MSVKSSTVIDSVKHYLHDLSSTSTYDVTSL